MAFLPNRLSFMTLSLYISLLGIVPAWGGPDPSLPEPLWPLDLSTRYLTSNFMEYRGGRFHAGIDLKTNSETDSGVSPGAGCSWARRSSM